MTAVQADAQVHPTRTDLQAVLAAFRRAVDYLWSLARYVFAGVGKVDRGIFHGVNRFRTCPLFSSIFVSDPTVVASHRGSLRAFPSIQGRKVNVQTLGGKCLVAVGSLQYAVKVALVHFLECKEGIFFRKAVF